MALYAGTQDDLASAAGGKHSADAIEVVVGAVSGPHFFEGGPPRFADLIRLPSLIVGALLR